MILVFDMDDTLYDEATYAHSGLWHVAQRLQSVWGVPAKDAFTLMQARFAQGRDHILDGTLQDLGLFTPTRAKQCVRWYRTHRPSIQRYTDVSPCFKRFHNWPKYLVTDGNRTAQAQKVKALLLNRAMRDCYLTGRYPKWAAKPSPHCFLKICERESVEPNQVIYVADNPQKDFVGIRPLGFGTIRVLRGPHKDVVAKEGYDAAVQIQSLDELTPERVLAWFGAGTP